MLGRAAHRADVPAVLALLEDAALPLAGVEKHLGGFGIAALDDIVGVAGLEAHGCAGLLRSVAVRPSHRRRGVARQLVGRVIGRARQAGQSGLYLLTTGAEAPFARLGFARVAGGQAPAAPVGSREFQEACPQQATLMHLPLKEMTMTQPLLPDHTQTFLDALAPHTGKPLIFALHGETLVGPGYHVTEVKAVTVEAMDCGGRPATWRETVVQLWNPCDEAEKGFMTVDTFLKIYRRVAAHVPMQSESELRFEYGDATRPTIQYRVSGVAAGPEQVIVDLSYPAVSCKPRDEQEAAGACAPDSSCCAPSPVQLINLG